MPTYTYGRQTDHYVEVPDPAVPGQPMRPTLPVTVSVRDATTATIVDLPPVMSLAFGYLSFTASVPVVRVSTDAFTTFRTLFGEEGLAAAVDAGQAADAALQTASDALAAANQALAAVATGTSGVDTNAVNQLIDTALATTPQLTFANADGTWTGISRPSSRPQIWVGGATQHPSYADGDLELVRA